MVQKACPRLWTIDEDNLLRWAVLQSQLPVKWPECAKRVPSRTGKQCRERYTSHLEPTLKLSEWLPSEDALVCRLHHWLGSKWASIARLLPGRTDNGVKNRFHHVRRRYERDAAQLGWRSEHLEGAVLKRIKNTAIPDDLKPTLWCGAFDRKIESDYNVGLFRRPTGRLCTRCSLLTPSGQTGDVVCDSTGWCKSCVETPIYVSDDALRIQHGIPACADINRVSISSSEREV
jgi:hypothetical protein